jgi:hypothetical protein
MKQQQKQVTLGWSPKNMTCHWQYFCLTKGADEETTTELLNETETGNNKMTKQIGETTTATGNIQMGRWATISVTEPIGETATETGNMMMITQ